MKLTLRPITSQETGVFFAVFSRVLESEFPAYSKNIVRYFLDKIYSRVNFAYWIEQNLKTVLAAYEETDGIIGFAVIDEPYGGVSLCRWLGVVKEYQKKGVGRLLINEWVRLATVTGCHKAELASQPVAKGFYEKSGLVLEGMRKLSYFGTDQYMFGKVIGRPEESVIIR